MSVSQSSAYCNVCQQQTLHQKPKINHVLHLVLTLVTLGLWGFVWLTLGIINASKDARCVHCGSKPGQGAIGPMAQQPYPPAPPAPAPPAQVPAGPEQPLES